MKLCNRCDPLYSPGMNPDLLCKRCLIRMLKPYAHHKAARRHCLESRETIVRDLQEEWAGKPQGTERTIQAFADLILKEHDAECAMMRRCRLL